ncbi:hypothetical protein T10_6524 [Trichinella papuae]|uniref:Uncharacterized protein n=1 Tax=Trichinella papuae TaxID=268474 RepID=A0A0V1MBW4_9BILA|nr:hypothetical protein T10_6524 [Trichinella papuae]
MNNGFYCFTQASLLASIKQLTRTFQLASLGQLNIKQSTSRVSGPGSLVILENHRALKHVFVYCKLIRNISYSWTQKTKMKPEYEESKLNHCDIVLQYQRSAAQSKAAESPGTKSRFHLLRIQLTTFICPYQSNDFVKNHRVPVVWFFAESPGTKSRFHLLRIQLTTFICPYQSKESNCKYSAFVVKNRVQFGCCSQLQQQRCATQSKAAGVNRSPVILQKQVNMAIVDCGIINAVLLNQKPYVSYLNHLLCSGEQ